MKQFHASHTIQKMRKRRAESLEAPAHALNSDLDTCPVYGSEAMLSAAPCLDIPQHPLTPRIAQQLVLDELNLDGNTRLNMASFVTTWMEPEADRLILEAMRKNFIDLDEYGQTAEIHKRCVNIIARLLHAPDPQNSAPIYTGSSTVGSSEAILLAVLAMKLRWRAVAAKHALKNPNLVFGANAHIVWTKACFYFDIEARIAPVSPDCLVLTPDRMLPLVDDCTIGVALMFASTINGQYEDVLAVHEALSRLNAQRQHNAFKFEVPIHVDAASGGFVAPFVTPDLIWDFRLPLVKSINISGHKFGLVYAGVGWVLFREAADLPEEMVFHINYLGGDQAHFGLNFSKSASNVIAQYYNLVRYGFEGYRAVLNAQMANARFLRRELETHGSCKGRLRMVDKLDIPLVAFALEGGSRFSVYDVQDHLRQSGWIVPAYRCPRGAEQLEIMRVVVKQDFSHDMIQLFVQSLVHTIEFLDHHFVSRTSIPARPHGRRYKKMASKSSGATNVIHRHSGKATTGIC